MKDPQDGYWHLGMFMFGERDKADREKIWQLFLGWLVKLFFLPLMFIYMGHNLAYMVNADLSKVHTSFKLVFDFAYNFLYFIDLLFVVVGYVLTIRVFDSHIRSAEPTLLGWSVALMCYQPFWGMISQRYLSYDQGQAWGDQFWNMPLVYSAWGTGVLLCISVYVWATLPFGIRFSNLTHRGIFTNGPYRYTKHPAYISKCISWWMISMPIWFVADWSEGFRLSFLLLLVNVVYYARAKTEERHLSRDPVYVEYMAYIEEKGIFTRLGKWRRET
jgi:protein-S-isoprenylcysteine O-methyltransferase Ste14